MFPVQKDFFGKQGFVFWKKSLPKVPPVREMTGAELPITPLFPHKGYSFPFSNTSYQRRYWKLIKSYKNNFYVSFLVHRVHFRWSVYSCYYFGSGFMNIVMTNICQSAGYLQKPFFTFYNIACFPVTYSFLIFLNIFKIFCAAICAVSFSVSGQSAQYFITFTSFRFFPDCTIILFKIQSAVLSAAFPERQVWPLWTVC